MISDHDNQVAVFIDYENIELSCREKIGSDVEVDWSRVLESAVDLGRVVIRRAYGDWSIFSMGQRELLGLGIELVHIPSKRGKNAADIRIVIDALEMMMGEHANISHVLLVSGDGDFTELVHRLRGYGKIVVGLGVSGASAEYLINACDQFIFYDVLANLTPEQGPNDGRGETTQAAFDVSEARQLLRRALQAREEGWINGGQVKDAMLRLNPAFNEHNYNFDSFKAFLSAQNDLVRLRTAEEGGHLEVQLLPEAENGPVVEAPEALLDRYLKYLSQQKIRMTPTEHRPNIILKFYDIYEQHPDSSLTELKEELHAYFEETAPNVKWQYVHETIHQLFRTFCFSFDQDDSNYPKDVRLWDRKMTLADEVTGPGRLLHRCDRGLLQKIGRKLNGGIDAIDREVAARLLYGSVRGQKMLDHVEQLVGELNGENGR
ncbi:MAG: NYN domain-containing protein [Candidatus Promineifilaceae bacterium]|nr:NYN domain-containing protein [Candidatus Promineifilaceae bacterium]